MIAELTGVCSPTYNSSSSSPIDQAAKQIGPLGIWTRKVAELTGLDTENFSSAYTALMNHLDTHQFKGQL